MKKLEYDYCASCGGDLDTGWECNDCGRDWSGVAYPEKVKSDKTLLDGVVWWHFWNPLSGTAGGFIMGLFLSPFILAAVAAYMYFT